MRKVALVLMCLVAPGLAQAVDCSSASVPQATPLRPSVIAPISPELAASAYQLGTQVSVLTQAYDETQSADQVLLRLRIEGCQNVAKTMPAPSAIKPDDPAAYKPKTEFDNTPWRFDMSQNGKRMTADEFSAWMKSRGVRVAKGAASAVAAPAVAAPGAAPGVVAPPVPATSAAPTPAPTATEEANQPPEDKKPATP